MLTRDELKRVLRYEPATGEWFWRVAFPNLHIKPGDRAGCTKKESKGGALRWRVKYRRQEHVAARLAWLYMTGEWPKNFIDHRDGDTLNDCWSNLREATNTQNQWNAGKQVNNTSGYKNVVPSGNKKNPWRVRMRFNGKKLHIGVYPTKEAAHEAYKRAALRLHGEFANGGQNC